MALKRPAGAIRFLFRINMQHHSCDFAPISTFRICVEQAQIRDDVLLVINGQYGNGRRGIGDIRVKAVGSAWAILANRMLIEPLCFGFLGILMTRTSVRFALERTSPVGAVRSEKCQRRTHAPQALASASPR